MKEKLLRLMKKYKEILAYLVVGVLTTVVNYAVYYLPGVSSIGSATVRNTVAWVAAVLFAFFANRRFVYTESTGGRRVTWGEFAAFVASRLFSLVAENVIIFLVSDVFKLLGANIVKIPTSVIVVVLNYITGKLVFKKKEKN